MWRWIGAGFVLALSAAAFAHKKPPETPIPSQFEIGRHTFFDFGPPFNYYEIFVVRPSAGGTDVERITLTPAADRCFRSAQVETASAVISQSVLDLFQKTNPCAIPEKDLRRELKPCKKCLVFSGANISMQLQCGLQKRVIRSDILDRDMFDPAAHTPEHTSWTMQLLHRLDDSLGPNVIEKPIFPGLGSLAPPAAPVMSPEVEAVGAGEYDRLFAGAPDRASEIYKAAQGQLPNLAVRLVRSSPVAPLEFIPPIYPRIAQLANASSQVQVQLRVAQDGSAIDVQYQAAKAPLFQGTTEDAIRKWRFPKEAAGQQINVVIEFNTNCQRN